MTKYLPDFKPDSPKVTITLRQMMSHRSTSFVSRRANFDQGALARKTVASLNDLPLITSPARKIVLNAPIAAVGLAMQNVDDRSPSCSRRVLAPLGLTASDFEAPKRSKNSPKHRCGPTACGFRLRLSSWAKASRLHVLHGDDLAKFMKPVFAGGGIETEQGVHTQFDKPDAKEGWARFCAPIWMGTNELAWQAAASRLSWRFCPRSSALLSSRPKT